MLLFGQFTISALVSLIFIMFFGMGIHEFAHAWMADYWGDPTPRENGKLTLNPLAHIDWYGWLMIMLIGFGIAGSVAINPRRMRDGRWGNFWTSLAGPLSNLAQAIIFGILFRLFGNINAVGYMLSYGAEPWEMGALGYGAISSFFSLFLYFGLWFNIIFFLFNLLPLAPLDGYTVMQSLLPGFWLSEKQIPTAIRKNVPALAYFLREPAFAWASWRQITTYIFIGLLLLSFMARSTNLWPLDIIGHILRGPGASLRFLLGGV